MRAGQSVQNRYMSIGIVVLQTGLRQWCERRIELTERLARFAEPQQLVGRSAGMLRHRGVQQRNGLRVMPTEECAP